MSWPTTDDPRTEFVTVRLTATESAEVSSYASKRGLDRSKFVRECVDRVIAAEKKRAKRAKGETG